ncbi:MAG: acyl carrier protein [Desulfovibrionaceae bacterium]|nr:acyl carrier protein [Desulfovibrionaceae bacterium]
MTKKEFLAEFQEILQRDEPVQEETPLASLAEWDSVARMVLIAFFDRTFGQQIKFDAFNACHTVADLMALTQGGIV